jgi:hypothetical protein
MNVYTAARVAVAASFAFLFTVWIAYPWVSGDTPFVLDGSNALITCLSHHQFHACGFTGKLNYWGLMSPMGDWPLLQHIPDLIVIGFGGNSHPTRTRVLELLNVAGVAASLVAARVALARAGQAVWFWGFALVLLSSPILWYARTTSNEVLAAGLLVCLVSATVVPATPPLVGLAALGAALTKETSYPFVAAVGLIGLALAQRRTGKPVRSHIAWGVAGLTLAFAAASLFNVVRYGSIWNRNYLDSQLHTHGAGRILEYSFAVLVSPSGGVLFFWPAATVVVATACLLPFIMRSRGVDVRPAVVLAAVVLFLTIGFASWWTPFGWSAYGPRLMLPWGLPLVLLAFVAYGKPLLKLARRVLVPLSGAVAVFAVVLAFTLPNIGQTWRPNAIGGFFLQENPPCNAPWRGGAAKWNACQHRQMWLERPMPLYALHGVKTPAGLATTVIVALGLAGCLFLLRGESTVLHRRAGDAASGRSRDVPCDVIGKDVDRQSAEAI